MVDDDTTASSEQAHDPLAFGMGIATALFVILIVVALAAPQIISESDLYLAWALASWAATVILMQAHRHVMDLMEKSIPTLTENVNARKSGIQRLVDETWQPYVRSFVGREEVCIRAAEAIRRAHKEPDYSDRFILFQGAASLSTSSKREEEWGVFETEEEDAVTPYQLYSGAIDDAVSDHVRMRRFINLPTAEELGDRSSFLIRDYLDWHAKEFYRLKRNENYILVDSPRTSEWRSGISAILTRRSILFIVGKGEAGLLVQDDRIAEVARIALNESLLNAEMKDQYGEPGPDRKVSLDRFRDQAKPIRELKGET